MQTNGKIESCEIAIDKQTGKPKTGFKKNGEPWTNYKYKISGRWYSGFGSLKDFDIELGNQVIVEYNEEPNPNNASKPYKNIVNITRAKDKEADKQYHVKDVGEVENTPDEPENIQEETIEEPKAEPNWDKINAEKEAKIKKGMVFNKTVDWIIATRRLALEGKLRDKENKVVPAYDYKLEKNFDTVFDFLMSKAK